MANVPLKSIKFPGLDDTYTIAAEEAADIAELKSAINNKIMWNSNSVDTLMAILQDVVTSSDVSAKLAVLEEQLQYEEPVAQTYYIANNLTHAANSNSAQTITAGSSYTGTITASGTGYVLETVTVTMGGVDITSTAYTPATGVISIASVTGDVIITAVAMTTIYLTPVRANAPDTTTYEYELKSWQTSLCYENKTIKGGTMVVTFDDAVVTGWDVEIFVLDSNKSPYEAAGYKNPENLNIEGHWTPYYVPAGSGSLSFGTVKKSFYLTVPENCYAFLYMRWQNATYDGTTVTDSVTAATWAINGGLTVGIKGGVEDEQ